MNKTWAKLNYETTAARAWMFDLQDTSHSIYPYALCINTGDAARDGVVVFLSVPPTKRQVRKFKKEAFQIKRSLES